MPSLRHLLLAPLAIASVHAAEDRLIAGFEEADFGAWKATGTAFGPGPATGPVNGQMEIPGFSGKGFANSYHGGDDATGTLTSPEFTIERRYLNFLIGGGKFPGETCLNLLVDGKAVRTATGPNIQSGGSERMSWETWDLAELAGKKAVLELVDRRGGTWGHITADEITQSDTPKMVDATATFTIDQRYLIWPIAASDSQRTNAQVFFELDGKPFTFAKINLGAKPDFWTFTDLANFQGKTLTIKARIPGELLPAWQQVKISATYPGEKELYQESLRPQFHFSSRRGWLNDPNGLVYADGVWHLFYQHNPYNHGWNNMHWGHATSTDLLHWKEMPDALYPGPEGTMYSGSGFIIPKNRTSIPLKGETAIGLAYTAEGAHSFLPDQPSLQGIAISEDGGKTFTKFDKNPVVGQYAAGNRDPKVFWYEGTEKWIMPLYLEGEKYGIFTSPDLVTWTYVSQYEIPGDSECPDLFEISLADDRRVRRWIAWGANGRYLIGRFDGTTFQQEGSYSHRHYFGAAYAGQTYSNAPDGRRVHIGWMRDGGAGLEGQPFNLQMTLPMDFTLRTTAHDLRLWIEPSPETVNLRTPGAEKEWKDLTLGAGLEDPLASFKGELFEVDMVIDAASAKEPVGLRFFDQFDAVWNPADQTFTGAEGAQEPVNGKVRIHTFIDRTSMESFVNGTYVSRYIRQAPGKQAVKLIGSSAKIESLKIVPLKSVWK